MGRGVREDRWVLAVQAGRRVLKSLHKNTEVIETKARAYRERRCRREGLKIFRLHILLFGRNYIIDQPSSVTHRQPPRVSKFFLRHFSRDPVLSGWTSALYVGQREAK